MAHRKQPRTNGGARLRALREVCGKTQLDVEMDAKLGVGYLQRLELGKVQRPEQDTLEHILSALHVSFKERRNVLDAFGYAAMISMPDDVETDWAIRLFHSEVAQNTLPAYLLDCSHRLLAWNPLVPHLFGALPTNATGLLMPRLIFDRKDGVAASILNAETFFPAQIRVLEYEQERCGDGDWYRRFIDEMRQYEVFDSHWQAYQSAGRVEIGLRPIVLLQTKTGNGVPCQFRLIAESFAQDPRFRVIYAFPDDPATMQQCLTW